MPLKFLLVLSLLLVTVASLPKDSSEKSKKISEYSSSSNSNSSSDSNPSCFLPNCRKCDILDIESCTCTPVFVKCAKGFIFDEESCNCIESSAEPSACPSLKCPKGQHINEARCECTDKICQTLVACPSNTILDLETCECICNLDPNTCPDYYIFDEFNCLCRHPVCDPPGPCPGSSVWDTELCQCKCNQQSCEKDLIFDVQACECVSISSTEPSNCDPLDTCPGLSTWDSNTCSCVCAVKAKCFADYIFNNETCQCEYPFETSSYVDSSSESDTGSTFNSSSSCYIPDCRWCDNLDEENCICYRMYLDCGEGYMPDNEGCKCIPNPDYSSISSSNSIFSQSVISSCSIPDCRPCDYLDLDICECYRVIVDCMFGYQNTEDGCSCEPIPGFSNPWASYSLLTCQPPESSCPEKTFWNDQTCECQCIDNIFCIRNYTFNSVTCQCEPTSEGSTSPSIISQSQLSSCSIPDCRWCDYLDVLNCECYRIAIDCIIGYELSSDGCTCVPISGFSYSSSKQFSSETESLSKFSCSSPSSCPDNQLWNSENCSCQCIQSKPCDGNFKFDADNCECVCDPKRSNTTCPPGSVFDSLLCNCIEEIDCYDFNDPACACECEEILDCPPGKEFDLDYCDCLCPYYEIDPCPDGFIMSEESCECEKSEYP